jgi:hypothetical protein
MNWSPGLAARYAYMSGWPFILNLPVFLAPPNPVDIWTGRDKQNSHCGLIYLV